MKNGFFVKAFAQWGASIKQPKLSQIGDTSLKCLLSISISQTWVSNPDNFSIQFTQPRSARVKNVALWVAIIPKCL